MANSYEETKNQHIAEKFLCKLAMLINEMGNPHCETTGRLSTSHRLHPTGCQAEVADAQGPVVVGLSDRPHGAGLSLGPLQ